MSQKESDGLNRREWLALCGAAGAVSLSMKNPNAGRNVVPATSAVDHLLLGIGDLDAGIAWVEKNAGVKAVVGGSHPGVGTRNALLALGGRRYLEILAPDPAQTAYNFPIDVRKLTQPRLVTWAAGTNDIASVATRAREAGFEIFGPREGSRARPDGKTLSWKSLGVVNTLGMDGVEPIPFFIEWAQGSPHPSQDSPQGCELEGFAIEHPQAASVVDLLGKLGIEADVKKADRARLAANLRTPKGKTRFS